MLNKQSSFLEKLRSKQTISPGKQRIFYFLELLKPSDPLATFPPVENLSSQTLQQENPISPLVRNNLSDSALKPDCLTLSLVVASIQDDGQLETVQPYALQPLHLMQPPLFLQADDLTLLKQLDKAIKSNKAICWMKEKHTARHIEAYILQSPLDCQWLQALCLTGRARQAKSHRPVSWGSPLKASPQWHTNNRGEQCLRGFSSSQHHLLNLTTPVYWDDIAGQCGALDTYLGCEAWSIIVASPTITYHQVPGFIEQHGRTLQTLNLPLPEHLPASPAEIQPQITLVGKNRSKGRKTCLLLEFIYRVETRAQKTDHNKVHHTAQEICVGSSETGSILHRWENDQPILVHRDAEQEAILLSQFKELANRFDGKYHRDGSISFTDTDDWLAFMSKALPALKTQLWKIVRDADFPYLPVEADAVKASIEFKDRHWFDLHLTIEVEGQPFALLPLLSSARQNYSLSDLEDMTEADTITLPLGDGRQILMPARRIKTWLAALVELDNERSGRTRNHSNEPLRLPMTQITRLNELQNDQQLVWQDDKKLLAKADTWLQAPPLTLPVLPPSLRATPRPYQLIGAGWLQQRARFGSGGILADDMGLGKTLQTLIHILLEKQHNRLSMPVLVVSPRSVSGNWFAEAKRFTPELKCLLMLDAQRHQSWQQLKKYDLVISSYHLVLNDEEHWQQQALSGLILDEAQMIKNPKTKTAKCLKAIQANYKLCLTGTPMENHLGELWSLFDFVLPGFLDSEKNFNQHYRKPVEQEGSKLRRDGLMQRIAPFMLRRCKHEVASELPEKTDVVVRLPLQNEQRDLYETLRLQAVNQLFDELAERPATQGRVLILNALMQLRQLCCDPQLLGSELVPTPINSAKREHLLEMVSSLVEEGRTILVFSQFTRMLDLIRIDLKKLKIDTLLLTGKTRDRSTLVEQFQNGKAPVFLISLKAGGTGLNLTRADTVIHYDPWWNRSAEQQATDRVHRIGQHKPVFVYKLLTEDTIEEKIHYLQQSKQDLLELIYHAAEGSSRALALENQELLQLLTD